MTSTRFTALVGCERPLQLAGMGHVSGIDLAVAVAEAGGLGMLAVPLMPAPVLDALLAEAAARTERPLGLNILVPFLDPEALDVAAARLRVVEFFYGDPSSDLVARATAAGARCSWQVGDVAEARAAADAGADFVVVQGVEAGGHVRGTAPLLDLLGPVLAAVDVPVVAAGGLGTAADVAAAFAAGADAVRIGTRFVAAAEADAHPAYVDALIGASADDTVLTTAFDVMWPDAPHRVLRSALDAARADGPDPAGTIELGGSAVPVPRRSPMVPTRSATGDIASMALYAGESVGAVTERQPAAAIVDELLASVPATSTRNLEHL